MDYIQEELRRQREVLAGLLLGTALPRSADGGGDSGPAAALRTAALAAVPAAGAAFSEGKQGSRPAAEGVFSAAPGTRSPAPGVFSAGSGGSAVLEVPGAGGRAETVWETAGFGETAESAGGAGWAVPAEYRRQSGTSGRLTEAVLPGPAGAGRGEEAAGRREARRTDGGAVLERTVTEFVRAEGGGSAAGAEALSRAFQRDARRYDGGFSLY